jgi:replicative DNA helicase
MASPELELISNIVRTGDFSQVRKRGLDPEFFRTEEGSVVFQWLWGQFHDLEHRGEVPDKQRLLRKFPDFDFCASRNSIAALITELSEDRLRHDLDHASAEMMELIDSGEDPRLVLQAYLPTFRELNVKAGENSGLFMRDGYSYLKQEYLTTRDSGGVTGIPFPWEPLNKATGGMHSEQFILVYGRPKNMKTWTALHIATHAYLCNYRVYCFSKEMRREDMLRRCASMISGVDYSGVKGGDLPEEEENKYFDVLDGLSDWEDDFEFRGDRRKPALYFDSDKGRRQASTVDDLMARAEKFEPDLVLVDGLYLMRDGRSKSRSADWKNITHISQDLKGMAQYLECPVLGTTQANRANAKAPSDSLDDLSFADSLGMDADLAMRVFKGSNPTSRCKYAIALTFPGVREADLNPFLINANPGGDFTLLQKTVNMTTFLEGKKKLDEAESAAQGGAPSKSQTPKVKKKRKPQSKLLR